MIEFFAIKKGCILFEYNLSALNRRFFNIGQPTGLQDQSDRQAQSFCMIIIRLVGYSRKSHVVAEVETNIFFPDGCLKTDSKGHTPICFVPLCKLDGIG